MVEIFCLMYSIQVRTAWIPNILIFSFQGYTEEEATERAMGIFESLDKNGDGSLAEDEFIKATQKAVNILSIYHLLHRGVWLTLSY